MTQWKYNMLDYTGHDQYNAVYTITIGELISSGVFDWNRPELDWSEAAYDSEQYQRVCDYFIERFYYREISIEPFAEWARFVKRKFVFEVMPKYTPLYEALKDGYAPLADEDEFYKSRIIDSSYPQTMMSGNSDYATSGRDEEYERIKQGNTVDAMNKYLAEFKNIDEMLLDEFETLFISMYTTNYNATW